MAIGEVVMKCGVFMITVHKSKPTQMAMAVIPAKAQRINADLSHRRFGHIGIKRLVELANKSLGLKVIDDIQKISCDVCKEYDSKQQIS
jgi:hypothetical protein